MELEPKLPECILVMGGPASGKGTYCKLISEEFNMIHLSIGDILREERKKDSEDGRMLDGHMKAFENSGKLMPMEVACYFLNKAINEHKKENKIFLIDGIIKCPDDYEYWNRTYTDILTTRLVLYLECSEQVMIERMKNRSTSSGRLDDIEKLFQIRCRTFFDRTYPCIELFKQKGIVLSINTEEGTIEQVLIKLKESLSKYFNANI